MPAPADRDLLFGLLALRTGLIDQSTLVAASRDKTRPMAEFLTIRGDIDEGERAALDTLVDKHLARHGDDVEKCLATVVAPPSVLGDADGDATLGQVADSGLGSRETLPDGRADGATMSAVGDPGDGRRFRLLRPHARGGLGEVFVALDAELNREVALKQILDRHADDPNSRTRFVLEAEITGGLEHPGIVPVYGLGAYGDGRPYYAMRFIRGDSLKDAIAAFHADHALKSDPGRRSLALRKLLRRFVDVCNAIDYAHGRGVLHRDIKPANIIVGKHGETLVVDWGLAKAVGRPGGVSASEERALLPLASGGSAETMPGSALGTPAYMSPEQAVGDLDQLGPRSDVYSLGATLYHILTGRPAFGGDNLAALLLAVKGGKFPPPRDLDPTVDRSLEAVCLKAMATRPEDRYPGPRALADDVERWAADEPVGAYPDPWSARLARATRRHRTAVASAAALLLTAVVGLAVGNLLLGAANRRTEEQRRLATARELEARGLRDLATAHLAKAEANFRLAHDAVDRFLGRVIDDRLLNEPFMTPLRRELLTNAREFYQAFVDQRSDDPGAAVELARAHFNLGRIVGSESGPKESIGHYERARAALEAIVRDRPGLVRAADLLLSTLADLGRSYEQVGRLQDAEATYGRGVDLGEALARDHPEESHGRMVLASTLGDRGGLLSSSGRHEAASADLRRSLGVAESLARDRPNDLLAREALSNAQFALGLAEYVRERFAESIPWREKAVSTAEGLVRDDPASARHRVALGGYLSNLGSSYQKVRDYGRAEAALRRAVEIYRALVRSHPAITEYESRLAKTLINLSIVLTQTRQWDRAEEVNLEAIASQERLARDHPEVVGHRLAVGSAYGNEGNFWLDRKEYARALPWFEKSVAVMGELLERQPRDVFTRRVLRNSAWGQADVLVALGRPADSLPSWNKGIALAEGTAALEMRLGRAATLARIGATDRALAEAEAVLADPLAARPDSLFLHAIAARVHASAAESLRRGPAGRATSDALAARAVAGLRHAEEAGYFRRNPHRIAQYRDDPILAPLRARDDFRLLMMDLAMPAAPFGK